ncbi:hypothetical protein [Nocardiopsis suaedae]|uniref:Uncharacterized protein n=1 Tax=Nocardiopsis suaedae TaxID=3018444 RepID=A0ABT4TKP7_9ACTN|nr:hypothetical protein [Nocardiopsis suaedae]MDA2805245.1 hypothetical protein [Nocardiopsis suaedae]
MGSGSGDDERRRPDLERCRLHGVCVVTVMGGGSADGRQGRGDDPLMPSPPTTPHPGDPPPGQGP